MKKITLLSPLFFGLALAIGFYLGKKNTIPFLEKETSDVSLNYNTKYKLFQVMETIKRDYVDSISEKDLTEKTIKKLLSNLDPHSVYIPYQKFNHEEEVLRGNFAGVGVKFIILKDTLFVTNVIKNGPSFRAGLENGDRIIKIDTTNIAGVNLKNETVMKLMKGKPGTPVNVSIFRRNNLLNFKIVRGIIPIKSVTASFMVSENTGYLKLVRFGEKSHEELFFASKKLLEKGMTKLIFDLRGNGGGYLQIAERIVDEFLPKGKLIVYTMGKSGEKEKTFSTSSGILKDIELSILIDSESASASEIVAGAIQDNDRGTIYGRRSFGKGLVQKPVQLPDSSSFRITIARYYTPTGRCIQKHYKNGDHYNYMMELYDREKNGGLFALDSSVFVDSLKFTTPGRKTVYGGGGITPDIFIPFDTSGYSPLYRKVMYSRLISEFSIHYLDRNRGDLESKSLNYFTKTFKVTDEMYSRFLESVKADNIPFNEGDKQKSKRKICQRLKEEIASGIWDDEGRIYINVRKNKDVKTVLDTKQ